MGMARVEVRDEGLSRWSRTGDGWLDYLPVPAADVTDGNVTMTVAQITSGFCYLNGFTAAGHNLTTPVAADIIAALPEMDIGDTYVFAIANNKAFNATLVAGDGDVTLAGLAVVNAGIKDCIIKRLAPLLSH